MYDIQSTPRSHHRHPRNAASYNATAAATAFPAKIRLLSSSSSTIPDSSKSFSSTPTSSASYAVSPSSLASPFAAALNKNSPPAAAAPAAGFSPLKSVSGAGAAGAAAASGNLENDDETMQTLVERFSSLETEIKGLLKGKNSLKDRIQSLGSKQESMKSVIQNLEDNQLESIKSQLDVMEQQATKRAEYLEQLKKERIQSLEQAKNSHCMEPPPVAVEQPASRFFPEDDMSRKQEDQTQQPNDQSKDGGGGEPGVLKRIVTCWNENNCDLHLKRLIHSSRQIAAYEILEFAHKRLSTHLINHISETARALVGDEKTGYLAQFLKHGPFESKPVGQGTYGELLKFVQREQKPRKELLKALKSAENSLVAEAVSSGYRAYDIGEIRSQMTGFFTTAVQPYSRYCHPIPLADTEVSRDIVEDTRKAADEGKLGALQKASKLIKLGCHFLRWQLAAE